MEKTRQAQKEAENGNEKTNNNLEYEVDYEKWSKAHLIDRIRQLEKLSPNFVPFNGVGPQKRLDAKGKKAFDFSKHQTRFIGLRFSYLGWNYQGLAVQKEDTDLPTVEFEIIKALNKLKLVNSFKPSDFNFSRCGRTDRGVSAMNQVISLDVRSSLTADELTDVKNDVKEIDYVRILNQIISPDIRFHSVCLRPPENFDARFSCISRHYKYIFNGEGLDIEKMNEGAKKFLGQHDFRNVCKIDASKQITNFTRNIMSSKIERLPTREGFYIFDLKGSAFLWHQVRCMVAVLLLIGQGHEQPEIIDKLVNIEEFPSRPTYNMAHDIPLVLYDCEFPDDVKWICGDQIDRKVNHHLDMNGVWYELQVKSILADFMRDIVYKNCPVKFDRLVTNLGDGIGKTAQKYTPLNKRSRLDTAEVLNEKWRNKKARNQ